MSGLFVDLVLAISLFAYTLTAGADFGVGILESFTPSAERSRQQRRSDHAIAPIWETNHIWIILALVIVFVAYPDVHVTGLTNLHIPLVLMLAGIVLRGTAFTFRYYDQDDDPVTEKLWSVLFRSGSLLVPMFYGHLAAALQRGKLRATPTTVWESYIEPWIGLFPLCTGIFTVTLFAWIAAVFLVGEVEEAEWEAAVARARRWTIAMVVTGGAVTASAWLTGVALSQRFLTDPSAFGAVVVATAALLWLGFHIHRQHNWHSRILVGVVVGCILFGYFWVSYPVAIALADGPPLTWPAARAPQATLDALAWVLLASSVVIFPSLAWLYRIFKQPT